MASKKIITAVKETVKLSHHNLTNTGSEMDFIEIDGSILEGGGQILRIAMSLSAICCLRIRVSNIRAGRSKPGLAAQHLKGIQLVNQMCNGRLKGDEIGSTSIEFSPGKIKGGEYFADTHTAGSISLLLQVALPCALYANSSVKLQLKGGTNADMAPQIDFMSEVFRPNLEKFGGSFDLDLQKRGYFPRGGGHAVINVLPIKSLNAVNLLSVGKPKCVHGWSFVAGTLPLRLTEQMSEGAKSTLKTQLNNIDIECYKETQSMAKDNASGIIMLCETTENCIIGDSGLGKRGIDAYEVGLKAAKGITNTLSIGACLDQYTQDQLIIFMALAEGTSSVRVGEISLHTKTAIYIVEKLTTVKFTIKEEGSTNIITCTGLGFINKNLP